MIPAQRLLLIHAALAIIRLERLRSGIHSEPKKRVVAEARSVLQAIEHAIELEPFGSDEGVHYENSRDLLQTLLADIRSTA